MRSKWDFLGGMLILVSIAFGATEYMTRQGDIQVYELFPYAVWMTIGLIIASKDDRKC